MKQFRLKGLKRYRSKGKWYAYHRQTGIRLKAEYGTAAFVAELAAIERKLKDFGPLPGTLGMLFKEYRCSHHFVDLAVTTRQGYERMMRLLEPIYDMPLVQLSPQFIASLRDKIAQKHGRRQANYVLAVISVSCEFGRERGFIANNPVRGIKRVRRARDLPRANRPWAENERRVVLENVPLQIKAAIALAMFTGLRKTDVLALTKGALREGRIWRRTSKTGHELSLPIHPGLQAILAALPTHDAITVVANSLGKPWTVSGFNSTFIKAINRLEKEGKVETGLTFHGLRHTVGTLLIEAGFDIDTVRRWLGQKTLAMAIHYSENADTSAKMREVNEKFDPLGSKKGTSTV